MVKEMINQVAELHTGIQWFHVGADEVGNEPCILAFVCFLQIEVEIIVLLFIQNNFCLTLQALPVELCLSESVFRLFFCICLSSQGERFLAILTVH